MTFTVIVVESSSLSFTMVLRPSENPTFEEKVYAIKAHIMSDGMMCSFGRSALEKGLVDFVDLPNFDLRPNPHTRALSPVQNYFSRIGAEFFQSKKRVMLLVMPHEPEDVFKLSSTANSLLVEFAIGIYGNPQLKPAMYTRCSEELRNPRLTFNPPVITAPGRQDYLFLFTMSPVYGDMHRRQSPFSYLAVTYQSDIERAIDEYRQTADNDVQRVTKQMLERICPHVSFDFKNFQVCRGEYGTVESTEFDLPGGLSEADMTKLNTALTHDLFDHALVIHPEIKSKDCLLIF